MSLKGRSDDELKEIFDQFDADNSGFISRTELLDVIRALAQKLDVDDDSCKVACKVRVRRVVWMDFSGLL